jgi:hypothetical protein
MIAAKSVQPHCRQPYSAAVEIAILVPVRGLSRFCGASGAALQLCATAAKMGLSPLV